MQRRSGGASPGDVCGNAGGGVRPAHRAWEGVGGHGLGVFSGVAEVLVAGVRWQHPGSLGSLCGGLGRGPRAQ